MSSSLVLRWVVLFVLFVLFVPEWPQRPVLTEYNRMRFATPPGQPEASSWPEEEPFQSVSNTDPCVWSVVCLETCSRCLPMTSFCRQQVVTGAVVGVTRQRSHPSLTRSDTGVSLTTEVGADRSRSWSQWWFRTDQSRRDTEYGRSLNGTPERWTAT